MFNIGHIKGIGEKNVILLNNLDIYKIDDLLTYYPYKHNIIKFQNIREVADQSSVIISCKVDSVPILRNFRNRMNSLSFRAYSNNKLFNVIIFNRGFLKKNIVPGATVTLFGKWDELKNTLTASDIRFEHIEDGQIESVYHLTTGLSNKNMRKFIFNALEMNLNISDYIPGYLNERYNFINKKEAVNKIHNPKDTNDIKKAKLKLKYEELFQFMFKINYLKDLNKECKPEYVRKVDIEELNDFIRALPFELTKDQDKAIKEIFDDMTGNTRMNRMLQGDVGSGKTIVGVIASFINYLSGFQTALMVPTEVLAIQHYNNIKDLLITTNMNVELLIGSTKKKEKEEIYEKLKNGKVDLIIGTHALLSEGVEFKNLGLIITDEQHRFGVSQRANLKNKGTLPDALYMSATPIPRTFALTLYGDMDISNIKTKPKGRKDIKTVVMTEKELKEVYSLMEAEIKLGHQVFIISPLIEDSETLDLTTVTDLKEKIDTHFNKKIRTEIMHGRLSKDSKDKIMNNFKNNELDVLISTTVIEVGVDIPNATMMIIFDAERFGLATLHQLRGRIGRNSFDSLCILIGSKNNKRLKVLTESNDGFYITEQDYELRGEGDLFGVKQSGDMSFKIADLKTDFKILMQTKIDSQEFLKENIKNNFQNYPLYNNIIESISNLD